MSNIPNINPGAIRTAMGQAEREQREDRAYAQLVKQHKQTIADLEGRIDELTVLDGINPAPAEWLKGSSSKKQSKAIACLMLSDLHLDELVKPEEITFLNAYARTIAEYRLKETIRKAIRLTIGHTSGIKFEGVIVFMNGDRWTFGRRIC